MTTGVQSVSEAWPALQIRYCETFVSALILRGCVARCECSQTNSFSLSLFDLWGLKLPREKMRKFCFKFHARSRPALSACLNYALAWCMIRQCRERLIRIH